MVTYSRKRKSGFRIERSNIYLKRSHCDCGWRRCSYDPFDRQCASSGHVFAWRYPFSVDAPQTDYDTFNFDGFKRDSRIQTRDRDTGNVYDLPGNNELSFLKVYAVYWACQYRNSSGIAP